MKQTNNNYIFPLFIAITIILFTGNAAKAQRQHTSEERTRVNYSVEDIEFEYKTTETLDKNSILYVLSLQKDKVFQRSMLEEDMQRIKKFYFDNGFFDAFIDTAAVFDTTEETVTIKYIILENKRYTIDKITLLGLEKTNPTVLSAINSGMILMSGEPYNRTAILNETGRILSVLLSNGYYYANLDTADGTVISKYPPGNPDFRYRVNVQLRFIGADRQYSFGNTRINIINNRYGLKDYLISRELTYKKGQIYDKDQIGLSERNFTKMSLVQSGRILTDTIDESKGTINFTANITLNKKYEVTPNLIAIDIDNQLFAGAGIEYYDKNFFGGGRTFLLGLQGLVHSKDVNRVDITSTIYQPYLFNYRMTGTYNLKLTYYNFDKTLQYITLQNLLRLNYFIATYTFYNSAYSDITVDLLRTKYKETLYSGTDTTRAGTITNQMNSIIGMTLVHDNTNDIFNPSMGSYHSFTVENAGLIPRFLSLINRNITYSQYFKFYLPARFYFDLTAGRATTIFATDFKIGDIVEYGKGSYLVPISPIYKFFSGGSNSLRGWNAKENGILVTPETGGTFLFEGSLEIRRKPFPQRENILKNIWTVVFLDYGNVWDKDKYFRINQIALAIGLGLRYETFIGPLRIDFGFKLYDPNAEDKKWLFQDISNTFKKNKFAVQFGLGNAF